MGDPMTATLTADITTARDSTREALARILAAVREGNQLDDAETAALVYALSAVNQECVRALALLDPGNLASRGAMSGLGKRRQAS